MRAVTELARYGVAGRNLRVFRTSAEREAALLQQILAPALRSRNPERRKEAVEALENLAAVASHLKHLLLVRDLRRIAQVNLARVHPRHPGLPEAGDRLQGHHAAAARPGGAGRRGGRRWPTWARPLDVDLVVAAEARGFILGAALARELGVGFVPARKPGKLPGETVSAEYILEYGVDALEMHADALADGARVLLHDDLLATGGTARALAELVEGAGAVIAGCASWSSWRSSAGARSSRRYDVHTLDRLRRRVRREQVFWGWGEPGAGPSLPAHADALLREELGISGGVVSRAGRARRRRAAAVARCRPGCASGSRRSPRCATTAMARVLRCRGKSYLDLLAQRAGDCASAPDAVVAPADAAGSRRCCGVCAEEGVAVVPFGGGTSVVGGLAGERGPFDALVSLDLGRLDRVLVGRPAVADRGLRAGHPAARGRRGAARARAGARPRAAELRVGDGRRLRGDALGRPGLDRARAHRRAGASALECVTPVGVAGDAGRARAPRPGPSLRELVLGSEGTLGVITRVALRVRPLRSSAPTTAGRSARSSRAPTLLRAARAGRARARHRAALRRGGDAAQPRAGRHGRARAARCSTAAACSSAAGRARTAAPRRRARLRARRRAARWAPSPGRAWAASRFAGPHLRDDLLDRGVLVETLETATSWSNLERLYDAVRGALAGAARRLPRLAPLSDRRLAVLHGARPPGPPTRSRQWRALKDARDARDRRRRRHDHPPPRDRPRPRALPRRRDRRARRRAAARGQGRAATRPGS